MSKQRVLITIGHDSYLLPDDVGAATIIKALSKAVRVWDKLYKGELQLREEHVSVGMAYVPEKTRLVTEDGAEVVAKTRPVREVKALGDPNLRLLMNRKGGQV
jgi:hypothetical protein